MIHGFRLVYPSLAIVTSSTCRLHDIPTAQLLQSIVIQSGVIDGTTLCIDINDKYIVVFCSRSIQVLSREAEATVFRLGCLRPWAQVVLATQSSQDEVQDAEIEARDVIVQAPSLLGCGADFLAGKFYQLQVLIPS
jgi:hypothetical protein